MYVPQQRQLVKGYPVKNYGVDDNQWDHCEVFSITGCIISQLVKDYERTTITTQVCM